MENKPFIMNVYHALSREQIENYLFRLTRDLIMNVIKECSKGMNITASEQSFIADFYKYSFVGVMLDWIKKGNIFNKDPLRPRKLLVHRYEINKIVGKIDQKGYTLVPLQIYFKGSLVKVEFALAKGKKLYDKRADIAKKDTRREAEREFKVSNLY